MEINGIVIKDPLFHPGDHDPDWRSRLAYMWSENPRLAIQLPVAYRNDKAIVGFRNYLEKIKDPKSTYNRYPLAVPPAWRIPYNWFRDHTPTAVKYHVEALLFTQLPISAIAEIISAKPPIPPIAVYAYAKLYYDIRDENDMPYTAPQLVTKFILDTVPAITPTTPEPIKWRAIARSMGYKGLQLYLHQDPVIMSADLEVQGKETAAKAYFHTQLKFLTGAIGNDTMMEHTRTYLDILRFSKDNKGSDKETVDQTVALCRILQQTAPVMKKLNSKSAEELEELNRQIAERISTEQPKTGMGLSAERLANLEATRQEYDRLLESGKRG